MSSANPVHSNATSSLGLDIGNRLLKFALVRKASDLQLIDAGSIEFDPGSIENGVIVDPTKMAKRVCTGLGSRLLRGKEVTFSIPSSVANIRWISLPNMPAEDLRDAAQFKVKRHLPYPVSQAYLEVTPTESKDGQNVDCLVVAVRRDIVDSRAESIFRAGLQPCRAELEAQAISRVIERRIDSKGPLWRGASLTIIDIGRSNTQMYVVQNQRLQFMRGVSFGSEMFGAAISIALEIEPTEAFRVLGHPTTELKDDGHIHGQQDGKHFRIDVTPELDKLGLEFQRLLRYFRSLHPDRSYAGILDHLVLTGGIASLSGLDRFLSVNLRLRVERAVPMYGIGADLDPMAFARVSGRQEAYAVAIGLSLRSLNKLEGVQKQHAKNEFAWTHPA